MSLFVFDWNGTLFDDTDACLAGANAALRNCDKPSISLDDYRETICVPTSKFYEYWGCNVDEGEALNLREIFFETYQGASAECTLRHGARELFTKLQALDVSSILLSNHLNGLLTEEVERFGLSNYFSSVLGVSGKLDSYKGLSKLDRLMGYCESSSIESIVLVGDSPEEASIAKAVSGKSVLISGGSYSIDRLKAASPDFLVNSLAELADLVPVLV